jgi:flagellar hook protein FlgE
MNLRYPNITALSEKEQLAQIKSFLHQLVDQLNYALPNAGDGASAKTYEVQGEEMSYFELRSLIIQEMQNLDALFNKLSGTYVPTSGWTHGMHLGTDENGNVIAVEGVENVEEAINQALEQAKASGEFDGPQGIGITNVRIDNTGVMWITYSNDVTVNLGKVIWEGNVNTNALAEQAAEKIAITMDDNGDLYYEVITDGNTNNEVEE